MNKPIVWSYWNHEPIYHLKRMANDGGSVFSLGEWVDTWYDRLHSEELIKKAEYTYSSKNDRHSNNNGRINGKIDWDCFTAVAMIRGEPYPVVFKIRTIDTDVRSQIYEIASKNETGYSRGDVHQEA